MERSKRKLNIFLFLFIPTSHVVSIAGDVDSDQDGLTDAVDDDDDNDGIPDNRKYSEPVMNTE